MYQRRRARVLLAVLVVLALGLVTVDFRSDDDGPLDRMRRVTGDALVPVQEGVTALIRPLGDIGANVSELFAIRADNQRLREQVDQLEERRRVLTDLERENQELRELLAIREHAELETVTARAVALVPSSFEWTITMDVGTDDGVERNMPVINGDGLVGRVIQVGPRSSRVLLAIDPTFSAAARTARTGEIGPIEGRGGDPMLMRPLDPEADIAVGDQVVTSSYEGGAFPAGIPIGVVADVGETRTRLTRELTVQPYVDFTRLHHLLVILHVPVDELPDFSEAELPELQLPIDPPGDAQDGSDGGAT